MTTQLSTTTRAGIAKFAFPSGTSAGNLLFKLSDSGAPDSATHFQVVSNTEISGYVTTGDFCGATNQYTLHFDMTFNRPITGYGTWTNGSTPQANVKTLSTKLTAAQQATGAPAGQGSRARGAVHRRPGGLAQLGQRQATGQRQQRERRRAAPPVTGADGAYLTFDTSSALDRDGQGRHLLCEHRQRVGRISLRRSPTGTSRRSRAPPTAPGIRRWARSRSPGARATQQTVFYTALYHSLLHPNVASDDNGQYMGFDGQVHTTSQAHPIYANYSGWDIYRSQSQLEAMLFPQQMSDTVTSMLDDYNQTGMLPKWSEDNGESYVMVGDPSDPIIADAYAFGARRLRRAAALTDMETEAGAPNNIRPGLNYYLNHGYLPIDGTYGCCNFYGPVSTQEEYNAADNAIASLASSLGNSSVASTFATRANNWQNVYNPGSGFLQPKLPDGAFQSGF